MTIKRQKILKKLFGYLLDVEAGARVVGKAENAREAVETVSDGDVDRFSEDAVPAVGIRDDLRVAAADVQDYRVLAAGDEAAHFYVFSDFYSFFIDF